MRKYHFTTNQEHLASAHRYISDWTPEKFIEQALVIGESVANYMIMAIEHAQHPEQTYKSCFGILSLSRKHVIADAIMHRIVHDAQRIEVAGESLRREWGKSNLITTNKKHYLYINITPR